MRITLKCSLSVHNGKTFSAFSFASWFLSLVFRSWDNVVKVHLVLSITKICCFHSSAVFYFGGFFNYPQMDSVKMFYLYILCLKKKTKTLWNMRNHYWNEFLRVKFFSIIQCFIFPTHLNCVTWMMFPELRAQTKLHQETASKVISTLCRLCLSCPLVISLQVWIRYTNLSQICWLLACWERNHKSWVIAEVIKWTVLWWK